MEFKLGEYTIWLELYEEKRQFVPFYYLGSMHITSDLVPENIKNSTWLIIAELEKNETGNLL